MENQKRVVIIGGGFAGSLAARKLEKRFSVTLIDTKDYFEFTPGILRTIINPSHLSAIQAEHSKYLKKAKILVGKVTNVKANYVLVNNKRIKFDYLIIASGSFYSSPIKSHNLITTSRGKDLEKHSSWLSKSPNILIAGGGLVGVELAAEICTKYPAKKITLVHANKRLAERNHPGSSNYMERFLKKRKVNIIYNELVLKQANSDFITNKGTRIKADFAFLCTGITPNSQIMKNSFSSYLNEKGYIKVNEFLQLSRHKNIFVVGDVNDSSVEKTAQNANMQVKIAASNIIALEKGHSLKSYIPHKTLLVISLGKWNGVLEHRNFRLYGIIPGLLKSLVEIKEMLPYKMRLS
jgi:NADH dehydrogenase FAD-containing subunit